MQTLTDRIVLITGASSGIGAATARDLAARGATVVLGARRTERLEALVAEIGAAGGRAEARALDVVSREDVQAFGDHALAAHGRIDAIVNNAGVMPLSPLSALKLDEWNRMIDVNLRGVLHGIAAVLPAMERQGFGHVVNVASIGAHRVFPTSAVYCATKYAVWALSEGLRQETDRLRVTVVSPGTTTSELADTITHAGAAEGMRDFRRITIAPAAVARAIAYALEQPADVDVSEVLVRPVASPY
ncbi:SDR family oxidoreductase [Luteimonas sp. FCS-9]|uniref:SDR family oxidoreductase n=1 Tax=Luteimonas sp. FCS-9 TaxID=1547516 RepID=UPI00063EC8FC|nr:SDR family oxidoreductase [Luteimonas sp. FCS-9]KLI99278.1 oxidoreductase [Luteimonas sp. FCS-9]